MKTERYVTKPMFPLGWDYPIPAELHVYGQHDYDWGDRVLRGVTDTLLALM